MPKVWASLFRRLANAVLLASYEFFATTPPFSPILRRGFLFLYSTYPWVLGIFNSQINAPYTQRTPPLLFHRHLSLNRRHQRKYKGSRMFSLMVLGPGPHPEI